MDQSSNQRSGVVRASCRGLHVPWGELLEQGSGAERVDAAGLAAAANSVAPGLDGVLFLVLIYSIAVLTHVATMGTIGVRCMFGTRVEEEIPTDYVWKNERPHIDDWLLSIGPLCDHNRRITRTTFARCAA